LRGFTHHPLWRESPDRLDLTTRVQLWCVAHDWQVTEGSRLHHDDTALSRPVTIVLALTSDPDPQALAIVVDEPQVSVYPDRTTDEGFWHQPDTVDLVCPSRHRHTWLGDGEVIDSDGTYATIHALFGPDPRAPYTDCRTCHAYHQDPTSLLACTCGGVSAIYCPRCGDRCRLQLPDMDTYPSTGGHA
jgi:hypothetical protein